MSTGREGYALDSWRALMGFASIFRMDSPLVDFGASVCVAPLRRIALAFAFARAVSAPTQPAGSAVTCLDWSGFD